MIILGLVPGIDRCAKTGEKQRQVQAAALVEEGQTVSIIDTRRLLMVTPAETSLPPLTTVGFVLNDYGIKLNEVDKIALLGSEDDWKREDSIEIWDHISRVFQETFDLDTRSKDLFFVNHDYAFGMNMFLISGFKQCLFLTWHNLGDEFSLGILKGKAGILELLDSFSFPGSPWQDSLERDVIDALSKYQKELGYTGLCITGNRIPSASLEEKIRSHGLFEDIFVLPARHAGGWAMGAALYLYYQEKSHEVPVEKKFETYRNETERALVQIWQEMLLKEKISIHDDFFELGGNSLKAITILSIIHRELKVSIPLAEFFNRPTIGRLAKYIENAEKVAYFSIESAEKKEYYALSSAQERLYILQQMSLENIVYNIPMVYRMPQGFDTAGLEKVLKKLLHRHESLRTSFHMHGNEPVQRVHHDVAFYVEFDDLKKKTGSYTENHELDIKSRIKNFVRPFELSCAPLFRVGVINNTRGGGLLLIDMHHIISDEVSHNIFLKEFLVLQSGETFVPLRIQYKEYSQWQKLEKNKQTVKQQEEYWLGQLKGNIPKLRLPLDYPRPGIRRIEGNTLTFTLDRHQDRALRALAADEELTLFILLLGIFKVMLTKVCRQEDIVVGINVAGRRHADLHQIIGFFVNQLVISSSPKKEKNFTGFLRELKRVVLKAFENQDYPFNQLVEQLEVKRKPGHNPLFDVLFVLNRQELEDYSENQEKTNGEDETGDQYFYQNPTAKFDLTLACQENSENLFFSIEYAVSLFKEETMQRFIKYFKEITAIVLENRTIPIKDIQLTSPVVEIESSDFHQDLEEFEF